MVYILKMRIQSFRCNRTKVLELEFTFWKIRSKKIDASITSHENLCILKSLLFLHKKKDSTPLNIHNVIKALFHILLLTRAAGGYPAKFSGLFGEKIRGEPTYAACSESLAVCATFGCNQRTTTYAARRVFVRLSVTRRTVLYAFHRIHFQHSQAQREQLRHM